MRTCALPLILSLLLVACGGQPPRGESAPQASAPAASTTLPAPTSPARKPAVIQKRGGAYYKDDGPGEDIPAGLDTLADARPRSEALHRFANRPYVVLGKLYVPQTGVRPFQQRGIASWYGKKFHGQKTSTGETYDMFAMTAAHPTLALPSYARVTNVHSGASVIVRVTDRGPFHADRVIDLSYAAAYRLGYVDHGSTLVDVEAIMPGDAPVHAQAKAPAMNDSAEVDAIEALAARLVASEAATGPAPQLVALADARVSTFLQLGAFSNADNAEILRSHLSRELDWLGEAIQISTAGALFRVQLGPYAKRSDAEKVAERIRSALGYPPVFVTR